MAKNNKKYNKYNKTSGNGKRGNKSENSSGRDSYKDGKSQAYNDYVGKENDPRWYTHNQRLIQDVTKIPFNSQVGKPVKVGETNYVGPSIMTLTMVNCPGIARDNTDGVNLAGQALFQKLRKDLSTYASYAPADTTMEVLAIIDVYTRYAEIARIFGVANLYSSVNLSYPTALLQALGMDMDGINDLYANMNDYRAMFNNLIYKAQTLYLPAAFPILERYLWMYSNIFSDHNDPRAQLYAYVPAGHWFLDEEADDQGTTLTFQEREFSVINMLDAFNAAIERIRNSDSMLKIMADMRKAFQDVAPWKLSYIDENFMIYPTYSTEVLSQIENTVVMPGMPTDYVNVEQDVMRNTITYRPLWRNLENYIYAPDVEFQYVNYERVMSNYYINMHWTNPTSDDIIVATRNIPTVVHEQREDLSNDHCLILDSCGSDYCVGLHITTLDGIDGVKQVAVPYLYTIMPTWAENPTGDLDNVSIISPRVYGQYQHFDWAPRTLMYDFTTSATGKKITDTGSLIPVVESDNYTSVNSDLMRRIHNNVILSMWNVPELGTTYN